MWLVYLLKDCAVGWFRWIGGCKLFVFVLFDLFVGFRVLGVSNVGC